MTSSFGLDPVFPVWVVVAVIVALFGFFIYLELQRKQKFLVARIIAQVVALASLLGAMLRPSLPETHQTPVSVLLTPGFEKSKIDSLKSQAAVNLFAIEGTTDDPHIKKVDLNEIGTIPNLTVVAGQGIPADALELVEGRFNFMAGRMPSGIVKLDLPQTVLAHQVSSIRGVLNARGNAKLILNGPAGAEDSVNLRAGSSPFELRFNPKQAGLWLYKIIITQENTTPLTESIPIEVKPEQPLKILFIQKFPTAETRYLKNFLSEKGHRVTLRYQISKTNFNYEYSNTPSVPIGRLTHELLSSFDLLFIDQYTFDEMSGEKPAIRQSINDGLGVIFFADQLAGKSNIINDLLKIPASRWPDDTVHMSLASQKKYVLPAIPISVPSTSQVESVLGNRQRILAGYIFSGTGKVGFQLLRESYRIGLEGNSDDYAFVWRGLIERIARFKKEKYTIVLQQKFPYVLNESVTAKIMSDGTQPMLHLDKTYLPMAEDVVLDDVWSIKFWNTSPGWHALRIKGDSTRLNYFVSDTSEWKALRATRQTELTSRRADIQQVAVTASTGLASVNPIYFYLLFLLASGFLWLAPKL